MKKHTVLGLLICTALVCAFHLNLTNLNCTNAQMARIHDLLQYDLSGRFVLSNTTEKEWFVSPNELIPWIGTTWNLMIGVDANSSSDVRVSFNYSLMSDHPERWEGPREFSIKPDDVESAVYISHFVADFIIYPNYYIELIHSIANASGFFQLNLTHRGYRYDVGTSHLYVSNITAWLENPPDSDDKTPIALYLVFYGGGLIVIILMIIIMYRVKRE